MRRPEHFEPRLGLAIPALPSLIQGCVGLTFAGCVGAFPLPAGPALATALDPAAALRYRPDVSSALGDRVPERDAIEAGAGLTSQSATLAALAIHPELRAARTRRGIGRAQIVQAGILPNPQLSAWLDIPTDGRSADTSVGYSAQVSWALSPLVAIGAAVDAERHSLDAIELDIAWQEWQVAQRARLGVIRLAHLKRRLAIARRTELLMRDRRRTLGEAVAVGNATALEFAAAQSAWQSVSLAILVTDRLEIAEARSDALARAHAVMLELGDEPANRDELDRALEDFAHGGMTIAVFGREGRLAGSERLPRVAASGCQVAVRDGEDWMVCAVLSPDGNRIVGVGRPRAEVLEHRSPLLAGGLVALLVVGMGAVLGGLGLARRSLRPLVRLGDALANTDPASPGTAPPLPRSGLVEIDTVADTLTDLLERLHRELQRSRRFTSDAAHELRTPLTKMRTELELMLEELPAGSAEATRIRRLVSRTEGLGDLVERLLVLASPVESLRSRALVLLSATVELVVENLSEAGRVEASLDDDGSVLGDATLLAAVVTNALGNALKFSDGPVEISVTEIEQEVVLRIDDAGPGLREEDRGRAFEPFFRAREHRRAPGHGIGLALIAHIVSAHGGTVAFVDEAPGSHLVVRLPLHVSC